MQSRTKPEQFDKEGRERSRLPKLTLLTLLVLSSFQTFLAFETYALTHREAYHACVERSRAGSHERAACLAFQPFFEGEGLLAGSLTKLREGSARLIGRLPEIYETSSARVSSWIGRHPATRRT